MFYGNRIQNRLNPDQVLDIANNNAGEKAKIVAWSYNGGANQQWIKVPQ